MRLQQWKANGWLQAHQTTPAQIGDLIAIVDRDLEDSMGELSPDWQFGIAYNAALIRLSRPRRKRPTSSTPRSPCAKPPSSNCSAIW